MGFVRGLGISAENNANLDWLPWLHTKKKSLTFWKCSFVVFVSGFLNVLCTVDPYNNSLFLFSPSFLARLSSDLCEEMCEISIETSSLGWSSVVSLGDSKVFSYAPLFPQPNYICTIQTHLKALLSSSSSFFFQFHSIRFAFVLFIRVPRSEDSLIFFNSIFFIFKNLWRRGDQSHLKRRKAYCILYV